MVSVLCKILYGSCSQNLAPLLESKLRNTYIDTYFEKYPTSPPCETVHEADCPRCQRQSYVETVVSYLPVVHPSYMILIQETFNSTFVPLKLRTSRINTTDPGQMPRNI